MASRVLPASRSILSAAQASTFVSLSHPTPTRRMRRTRELVLRAAVTNGDPGTLTGPVEAGDYQAMSDALLAGRPTDGEVCVFAYGSLIWKPACTVVEQRFAVAHSWHRAFCLGWGQCFRGTKERPGLMLALDRGGSCKGVALRLPPDAVEANPLQAASP